MYLIVPFVAGIRNVRLMMSVMTILITTRVAVVIKFRKIYSSFEFSKHILNKMIWFLFNALFIVLWIFEEIGSTH